MFVNTWLFKKYTSEVEIIDSLMAGVDENSLSGIALQEMREEYNNNFILSAKKMYEVVVDKCISEGKKVGKEVLNLISENSLGLYKAVDMAITVTGKLTGLSTASSAQLEFLWQIFILHIADTVRCRDMSDQFFSVYIHQSSELAFPF